MRSVQASPAGLSFYWRIATLFLREERATEEKVCLGETRSSPSPSPPGDPTAPPGGSLLKTLDSKGAQNNWSSTSLLAVSILNPLWF